MACIWRDLSSSWLLFQPFELLSFNTRWYKKVATFLIINTRWVAVHMKFCKKSKVICQILGVCKQLTHPSIGFVPKWIAIFHQINNLFVLDSSTHKKIFIWIIATSPFLKLTRLRLNGLNPCYELLLQTSTVCNQLL